VSWRIAAISIPVVVVLGLALAGCTQASPKAISSIVPTPRASSTNPAIPVFDANGTATQNLAYFNEVGHALLDNNQTAQSQGETIINWFVSHGFNKADMQVTPDKTSIGLAAWNIEFSVEMNNTCLIGQAGNTGFQSYATTPVQPIGKCLIGTTRTINW
jgi:hypothetical protein